MLIQDPSEAQTNLPVDHDTPVLKRTHCFLTHDGPSKSRKLDEPELNSGDPKIHGNSLNELDDIVSTTSQEDENVNSTNLI